MSLSILNNIAALYAQNNLNTTQMNLQNTLQQLSSGSRINSGADDAAGLAVADGLHANQAALTQSAQNATSGIGLLQTADGALSQVTNLLNRAVTLSAQSANGTLNGAQVSSANLEYQNILTQINNIGSATNFNSKGVFSATATNIVVTDGTVSGLITYADTIGVLSKGSVGLSAPAPGTPAAITNPTASASAAGVASVAKFDIGGVNNTVSGNLSVAVGAGAAVTSSFAVGTTIAAAVTQLNGQASFSAGGLVASAGAGADLGKIIITGPALAASDLNLTGSALLKSTPAATTPGAGVDFTAAGVANLSTGTAAAVLNTVTSAIADVAYQRGMIGANINQLTSASNVASSESVNLTAAEQSIRATNYGQAASDLSKYQILSQTGISALAQANSVQQEVLKLLQ